MKTSELRIGNLIMTNLFDFDGRITGQFQDIVSPSHFFISATHNDRYSPILITEKWLLRMGFLKDESDFLKHTYTVTDLFGGRFAFKINNKFIELSYIHQLQNLYFALTGEELIIKYLNSENKENITKYQSI